MKTGTPRPLEYASRRSESRAAPVFRRADVYLLGTFVLYAAVNVAWVARVMRPDDWTTEPFTVLFAFSLPLPLLLTAWTLMWHYTGKPRLYGAAALAIFLAFVAIGAAVNFAVAVALGSSV